MRKYYQLTVWEAPKLIPGPLIPKKIVSRNRGRSPKGAAFRTPLGTPLHLGREQGLQLEGSKEHLTEISALPILPRRIRVSLHCRRQPQDPALLTINSPESHKVTFYCGQKHKNGNSKNAKENKTHGILLLHIHIKYINRYYFQLLFSPGLVESRTFRGGKTL